MRFGGENRTPGSIHLRVCCRGFSLASGVMLPLLSKRCADALPFPDQGFPPPFSCLSSLCHHWSLLFIFVNPNEELGRQRQGVERQCSGEMELGLPEGAWMEDRTEQEGGWQVQVNKG
jgi:hypothetical protein